MIVTSIDTSSSPSPTRADVGTAETSASGGDGNAVTASVGYWTVMVPSSVSAAPVGAAPASPLEQIGTPTFRTTWRTSPPSSIEVAPTW
ncbi:hypothetical protein BRD11_04670 [Halobacteriales archaeon SW_12_69_24]|nr:MAG: hypothetical protein BRD11_04670 [Halobacteriales archaeon SW_12_69_24]